MITEPVKAQAWKTSVLATLISIAIMIPRIDMPWGHGLPDICGGSFMLPEMRAFETVGWARMNGVPYLGTLPTEPLAGVPYTHHPPGWPAALYLFTRFFGMEPWALRLLPALLAAAASGILAYWLALRGASATVTLVIVATRPLLIVYGSMSNPESLLSLLLLSGMFADELRREGSRPAMWVLVACAVLAPWADWQGTFLVPAILLRSLIESRFRSSWKADALVVLAASASVVLLVTWLGKTAIDIEHAWNGIYGPPNDTGESRPYFLAGIRHMLGITNVSSHAPVDVGFLEWTRIMSEHFSRMVGPWALCAIYLLRTRSREDYGRFAALALPGLLNILIFRMHARVHDFWVVYLAFAVYWSLVFAIDETTRSKRAAVALSLILACTAGLSAARDFEIADSTIAIVESGSTAMRSVSREGTATVWALPFGSSSTKLRGHVAVYGPSALPIVELAKKGRLTAPVDVFLPGTSVARQEVAALPEDVVVVEIILDDLNDPVGAMRTWALSMNSIFRVQIPKRLE